MSSHQPAFSEFVFTPGATQSGNLFGDWASLMNVISTLPVDVPVITFTDGFTIPNGTWNIRRGYFKAAHFGTVLVDVNDGVVLDNLSGITGGITLTCNPTTAHDTLTFSDVAFSGGAKIFVIAVGSMLNNIGTHPLITASTDNTIIFCFLQQMLFSMTATSPFVRGVAGSAIKAVENVVGTSSGAPDNWVEGTGTLEYFAGPDFTNPSIPGWVGPAPLITYSSKSENILYTPATPGNWPIPTPTSVKEALDDISTSSIFSLTPMQIVYPDGSGALTGDSNLLWNVGSSLFTANGTLLSSGTIGATPVSGAGTRFMYIPAKGALRAGTISADQWDAANVGTNSVAIGEDVEATGTHSVSLGSFSLASGDSSTTLGLSNEASGIASISIGAANVASGNVSFATGSTNTTSGTRSYAFGFGHNVTSQDGMAFGLFFTVTGQNAIGIALDNAGYTLAQNNTMAIMGGVVGIRTVTPKATLDVAGSLRLNYVQTATDYNVLVSDYFVEITSTAAARTMTLPNIANVNAGHAYQFIDGSNGAATHNILIKDSGGSTIYTINTNGGVVGTVSNGTTWRTF